MPLTSEFLTAIAQQNDDLSDMVPIAGRTSGKTIDVDGSRALEAAMSKPVAESKPLLPPQPIPSYVAEIFGPQGKLVQSGLTHRPGQLGIAAGVADCFVNKKWGMFEGVCGTGKGYAYLVPALTHASEKTRVLIAVHNNALLDQIVNDIPRVMEMIGKHVKYSAIKGKSNYVCADQVDITNSTGHGQKSLYNLSPSDKSELEFLMEWVSHKENSDLTRYPRKRLPLLMDKVTTDGDECRARRLAETCKYAGKKDKEGRVIAPVTCEFLLARQSAMAANVVVTNFSLAMANAEYDNSILGSFEYTILDEAHEFPGVARDHFTQSTALQTMHFAGNEAVKLSIKLGDRLKELGLNLLDATDDAERELKKFSMLPDDYSGFVNGRENIPWEKLLPTTLVPSFEPVVKSVEAMEKAATALAMHAAKCGVPLKNEFTNEPSKINSVDAAARMIQYVKLEAKNRATYVSISPKKQNVSMVGIPIEIGGFIRGMFEEKVLIVLSATLQTDGTWNHPRREFAMPDDAVTYVAPQVFDYESKAIWYTPRATAGVKSSEREVYNALAGAEAARLVRLVGGSTLILCSRSDDVDVAFNAISGLGYQVLKQNDSPPRELSRKFKEDMSSCLVGCKTYGTGFDVQGDALRCVIIWKMPFSPRDMLDEYLSSKDRNAWFRHVYMPKMMIDLRQWMGRLLRSKDDFGVICIMDSYAVTKQYRSEIYKIAPEGIGHVNTLEAVGGFMGRFGGSDGDAE